MRPILRDVRRRRIVDSTFHVHAIKAHVDQQPQPATPSPQVVKQLQLFRWPQKSRQGFDPNDDGSQATKSGYRTIASRPAISSGTGGLLEIGSDCSATQML